VLLEQERRLRDAGKLTDQEEAKIIDSLLRIYYLTGPRTCPQPPLGRRMGRSARQSASVRRAQALTNGGIGSKPVGPSRGGQYARFLSSALPRRPADDFHQSD